MRFLLFLLFTLSVSAAPLEKWIYKSTNMLVDKNVDDLATIFAKAEAVGCTHVLLTDSKFNRLDEMPQRYFANVERVKALAKQHKLTVIPALFSIGYSNDILSRDVNLVEAMPVRDLPMVVKNGVAAVDDPAQPKLGDFNNPKAWSWKDESVVFADGVARVTDATANARIVKKLSVQPYRQYHVSVWIKTEEFRGTPEIKAMPGSKGPVTLTWNNLGVKRTQDWTQHHAVFNSQNNSTVDVFLGAWGGGKGTLMWKDAQIEEVAFMNMPRRGGCPLRITADGKPLVEGHDFEKLTDPLMGTKPWSGEFDVWHQPPVLKTKLPDGTRLLASYYHTLTVYDGQAMICPSEPKTMELLKDQAHRVHKLWQAPGYMMSHDEIRLLNHCAACQARNLTPGQILAENVKACSAILREVNPGGRIYVWSDMFDPNHNAVPGPYYLVNGPFTGSWEGIEKDVTVLPWYYEKRAEGLKFFADRGIRQVIAGYYDLKPERIKDWLDAARGLPGIEGVMYTTWQNKYGDLEAFNAAVNAWK